MKILSDEDTIWPELHDRLNELGSPYGCDFHIDIAIAVFPIRKCQRFVTVKVQRRS